MAGLEPRTRALLREYREGKRASPPQRDALWSQIELSLGDATGGLDGDADGPSQATAAARPVAWIAGVTLAAAAVAAVVLGAAALGRGEDQSAPLQAPDVATPKEPQARIDAVEPSVSPAGSGEESPASLSPPPVSVPKERPSARTRTQSESPRPQAPGGVEAVEGLRAEMALIAAARAALHRGEPAAALRILQEHAKRFARGQMLEDRRVLRIEALCAGDKARQANAEVVTFAEAFPSSAHIARLRALCPLPR